MPVVVANMTAVAGRRMAETVARRGGITVLPQDIPLDVIGSVVEYVKRRHTVYETPITLSPHHTVGDALGLIHKRAHGAVVVVDDDDRPIGVFTEHDAAGFDRFTQLHDVMSRELVTVPDGTDARDGVRAAVDEPPLDGARSSTPTGGCVGVITRKGALRSTIYRPAVDADGRLMIAVAVGINGDPDTRPRRSSRWASTCSSSTPRTATRPRMLRAVEAVRAVRRRRADRRRQRRHRRRHARS